MFRNPFSFDGRISRTEYVISFIIFVAAPLIINTLINAHVGDNITGYGYIPILWFIWAQGAKRCHDLGNSGWYQLIPLYFFWLLFTDSPIGSNEYGDNPKGF